jgi:hypothetical protein
MHHNNCGGNHAIAVRDYTTIIIPPFRFYRWEFRRCSPIGSTTFNRGTPEPMIEIIGCYEKRVKNALKRHFLTRFQLVSNY